MARRGRDRNRVNKNLIDALSKAYVARAQLFHRGVQASKVDLLMAEIDNIDPKGLNWGDSGLGISRSALDRLRSVGGAVHQVFAHPDLIQERPHLIAYYRNIVTLSKKGIAQILFPTEGYEAGRKKGITRSDAKRLCRTLNSILSGVIEGIKEYRVDLSRKAILAEIGTELQGSWANAVGTGAARAVRSLLKEHIEESGIGTCGKSGKCVLKSGWHIQFGSEPDVSFFDGDGVRQIAIEVKGSLDVAGAQTRYGEARKSFGKALADNPRCHTVYLASCFTSAVIEQVRKDREVREWFNLTSILYDEREKQRFLKRIFHVVSRPV